MPHSQQTTVPPPVSDMLFLHFPSSPPVNQSTSETCQVPSFRICTNFYSCSRGLLTSFHCLWALVSSIISCKKIFIKITMYMPCSRCWDMVGKPRQKKSSLLLADRGWRTNNKQKLQVNRIVYLFIDLIDLINGTGGKNQCWSPRDQLKTGWEVNPQSVLPSFQ